MVVRQKISEGITYHSLQCILLLVPETFRNTEGFPVRDILVPWDEKRQKSLSIIFRYQKLSETPKESSRKFLLKKKSFRQFFVRPHSNVLQRFSHRKVWPHENLSKTADVPIRSERDPVVIFLYCQTKNFGNCYGDTLRRFTEVFAPDRCGETTSTCFYFVLLSVHNFSKQKVNSHFSSAVSTFSWSFESRADLVSQQNS